MEIAVAEMERTAANKESEKKKGGKRKNKRGPTEDSDSEDSLLDQMGEFPALRPAPAAGDNAPSKPTPAERKQAMLEASSPEKPQNPKNLKNPKNPKALNP